MALHDVEIVITDQTRPLTQAGFGLPLAVGVGEDGIDYAEVTSPSALVDLGYTSSDDEYKAIEAIFAQEPRPSRVAVARFGIETVTGEALKDALSELVELRNDWYWLVYAPRERSDEEIQAIGEWVGGAEKMFAATNAAAPDASTIVNDMVTLANTLESSRVILLAHTSPSTFPDAALVGRMSPLQPGSATFKFKTLQGVPEAEFTTTQIVHLHDASVNTYARKMGVLQTTEGFVTDGTYADIQIAKDWLKARMTERISRVLFVNEKIPYDNIGIAQIVDPIRATLQQATNMGIVARGDDGTGLFTVRAPRREEIDPNDRANRILPDVHWDAILAGAVHRVRVSGVVRV